MAGDAIITLHQFELIVILFIFLLTLLKIGWCFGLGFVWDILAGVCS